MIHFINETLFKKVRRVSIQGFRREQLCTLGKKSERCRVATLLYDSKSFGEHNLNVKSRYNQDTSTLNLVIRSNIRNTFDATVIAFAIPYNGYLVAPKAVNYRYRNALSITVTEDMVKLHPELEGFEKILYGVVEVHAAAIVDPTHKKHVEKVFVNIISKVPEAPQGKNFSIMIAKNNRLPEVKDGETIPVSKQIFIGHSIRDWNVNTEAPAREIPWVIMNDPTTKPVKRSNDTKRPRGQKSKSDKNTSVGRPRGRYKTSNVTESPVKDYSKSSYDDGGESYGKYPAKTKKELKNKHR